MTNFDLTPEELLQIDEENERQKPGNLAYNNDREPIGGTMTEETKRTFGTKPPTTTPVDTLNKLRQEASGPPPVQLTKEDSVNEIQSTIKNLSQYPRDKYCILAIGKLQGAIQLLQREEDDPPRHTTKSNRR